MAENLLSSVKQYVTEDVVSRVSHLVGEEVPATQKTFDEALLTLLGGLMKKANEPGGPGLLMDMVGEAMSPDQIVDKIIMPVGGIPAQLSHYLANSDQLAGLTAMGQNIVQHLFGEKEAALTNAIASHSGVNPSSASTIMNVVAPVLLGVVGQTIARDESGINGLTSLLFGQSDYVRAALPSTVGAQLGSVPTLGIAGGVTSEPNSVPLPIADPLASLTPPLGVVYPGAEPLYPTYESIQSAETSRSVERGNRWLPWLLLALGVIALFFVLRSGQSDQKQISTAAGSSDSTKSSMGVILDSAGSTAITTADTLRVDLAKLGAFFKRTLPTGVELTIPENGIENNLVKFIEDKNRPVDKTTWFNFGRLLFDTGKATLRPDSKAEVTNIAEILKAFPAVNIKIGGYTDNTGSAEVNKKLSQQRATTVMNEVAQLGIDKTRLEAEGYGPEHPVASNNTANGRAENRRIAVRVTKK